MAGFSYPTGVCACSRDKCSYDCETYSRWDPKPATNADRIRAMTDEELAEMMAHGNCGYCKIHDYCFAQKGVDCDEAWLGWLKSPVGKEGKG
jgi:hypothetical protein